LTTLLCGLQPVANEQQLWVVPAPIKNLEFYSAIDGQSRLVRKRVNARSSEKHLRSGKARPEVVVCVAPASARSFLLKFAEILRPAELYIAEHRYPSSARQRFLATRVLLRLLLSRLVDGSISPGRWRLTTIPFGRPKLAEEGFPPLSFNISHTHSGTVVAASRDTAVGVDVVDVETAGRDFAVTEGLSRCLSSRERIALREAGDSGREEAFLRLWSLKEAYAKLVGTGVHEDFANVEFAFDPLRQLASGPSTVAVQSWSMDLDDRPCRISLATSCGDGIATVTVVNVTGYASVMPEFECNLN